MKKIGIYILILTLAFSLNPIPPLYAQAGETDSSETVEEIVLFSGNEDEEIAFYQEEEDVETESPLLEIPDDSEALLIHTDPTLDIEGESYSFIQYEYIDNNDEELTLEGYVNSEHVYLAEEADQYREERQEYANDDKASQEETDESSDEDESPAANDESEDASETEKESAESDDANNDDESAVREEAQEVDEETDESFSISTFSAQTNAAVQESKTSKLGHLRSNAKIYETINGKSFSAGSQYTNAVYYIKKQAKSGKDTYYLISTSPSATTGVVGWVKAQDLSTHDHVGVDKKAKTFYVKGNGKATSKAWGGSKDSVYDDLSKYQDQPFKVNLTEKVGNNTWYRGVLDGKTVWLHSRYVYDATISKTSKLGHLRSNAKIYETINGKSFSAGSQYTNAVYYIKKQAKSGKDTYYLISTSPSSTTGVVGWVKAQDLSTHDHVGVDKKAKTFYVKGNGKATSKAWGGSKDTVYDDLSKYQNQPFKVNLTEKVGNNTWYRGVLEGKTVWVHSSNVETAEEKSISLLGHIRSGNVNVYKDINGDSFKAGSEYTNAVYYIKKQAIVGKEKFYLISNSPSAPSGVVGWVKEKDLSTHPHVGVDKKAKTFYVKGTGKAYSKAWGGSKDTVYPELSKYKYKPFKVHLTEKVGNNTWYRGVLDGKTVWLHSSYVESAEEKKISLLGHIRSGNVDIYKDINGESFKADSKYTNAVYYIKKQSIVGKETFYLISTSPSATSGVVGWVKEKDLSTHTHVGSDKKSKLLYVNGKGTATTKAWGGTKDTVYENLSKYKDQAFYVNLTEKVGKNTWYRGVLNGKTVWLHSSYTNEPSGTKTSKLGHIRSTNVSIYESVGGKSFKAGSTYTNAVYYIKKETKVGSQVYYLISREPSSINGAIGWVKSQDLSTHDHKGVDKKKKTFIINGKGKATTKAWGGSKDTVYSSLTKYNNKPFEVHLTEKVGNNTWYRGTIDGKVVWLHSSYVKSASKVIVIDAGHGGSDPGASANGLREKDLTLDLALKTKTLLEAAGYTVIMTRDKDEYLKLQERSQLANNSKADLFLSIHANSGGGTGVETWWQSDAPASTESEKFASSIQNEVIKETKARNRGIKDGNLHVNRETKMTSALIEVGFLDHKDDANKLKQDKYKSQVVKGIVNGIKKYFSS